MPELPEVETVRRGLAGLLPGKVVKCVEVLNSPRSFPNPPEQVEQFLHGAKVVEVRRRAKVLIVDLENGYSLLAHLKMTGQLVFVGSRKPAGDSETSAARDSADAHSTESLREAVSGSLQAGAHNKSDRFGGGHPTDSLVDKLPDRSTRVMIYFTDGSTLFFNDQRKFGWVKLMPTVAVDMVPFMQKLGPEPLEKTTTAKHFIERIRRRSGSMIKPAFLDQSVIAGVGNIYADEALWAAKIHPETRVLSVTDEQLNTLFAELVKVLALSIKKGGSTDRNYVDAEGKKGSYLSFANVFRREGKHCVRHPDQQIIKLKVAGRGTHICPVCQVRQD